MSSLMSRETRGISQVDRETAKLYYQRAVKDAQVRRWIFFSTSDRKIVDIDHSHGAWPSNFTIWDKMELKKKETVKLKYQGKFLDFSLVQICHRDFVEELKRKAEARLGIKLSEVGNNIQDLTLNESSDDILQNNLRRDRCFEELNETLDDFEPGVSSQGSLSEKENTMPMISPTNINVATATSTAKKPAKRRMSREDQDDDAVTEGPKRPRVCLGLSGPIDLDTTATSKKDVEREMFAMFTETMEKMLEIQNNYMEKLIKHLRAEKKEFLAVLKAQLELHGSPVVPGGAENDDVQPPVMYKGRNLMDIYAAENPSLFGRELARALFGEGKKCELAELLVGPETKRKGARKPCDQTRLNLFKECCTRKYPGAPGNSYEQARKSANQYGLEQRLSLEADCNEFQHVAGELDESEES